MREAPLSDIWQELQREPPTSIIVDGVTVQRGTRVKLCPRPRGDVFDQILSGKTGVVEGLDESLDGVPQVAVTLEDDPGRDMGEGRYPGHRFFFNVDEVQPIPHGNDYEVFTKVPRILVAGIGNIFLGDDGFGVAVSRRLAERGLPAGVDVRDFGIRGMDLAYSLQNDYDAVVFIDATSRGEPAGTLYLIDAAVDADGPLAVDTHGMDPVKVLAMARALGKVPGRVVIVACETESVLSQSDWSEMEMALSEPVRGSLNRAVIQVESVVHDLLHDLKS